MRSRTEPAYFQALKDASLSGVRANIIPGLVLWVVGITVVLAYYFIEEAREFFQSIVEFRQTYGFLYSGIATAIFGGLIPFLYLWASRRIPAHRILATGIFFVCFWGIRGIEVDAFYRLQAWMFGNDPGVRSIATKVFVDQFIYCPLWSAPVTAIFHAWMDADFSLSRLRSRLTFRGFSFDVLSVLLSIWLVWIPATAIIYSLPLPLQIPLFNLVLCFYVLLINALSPPETESVPGSDGESL